MFKHLLVFSAMFFNLPFILKARGQIYFKETDRSVVAISKKRYDDIRVFGKENTYWFLKNAGLEVEAIYTTDRLSSIKITRFVNQSKLVLQYVSKKNSLFLTAASITPIKTLTCTDCITPATENEICLEFKSGSDVVEIAAKDLQEKNLEENAKKMTDSSCDEELAYENMPEAIKAAFNFKPPGTRTPLTSCLKKEETKSFLLSKGITEDQQKAIIAKYELTAAKAHKGSENLAGTISCEESLPNGEGANVTEDGKIRLSNKTLSNKENLKKALIHETLHSAGVKDDGVIEELVGNCLEGKPIAKSATKTVTDRGLGTLSLLASTNSNTQQTASDPAAITQAVANGVPAEVAITSPTRAPSSTPGQNTPSGDSNSGASGSSTPSYSSNQVSIPTSSYELASAGNYNNYDDRGAVQAYNSSVQQSSGLLNFATAVTTAMAGAMRTSPTLAATTSLPAVAATGGGSTYQAPSSTPSGDIGMASGAKAARAASTSTSRSPDINAIAAAAAKGPDTPEGIYIPSSPGSSAQTTAAAAKAIPSNSLSAAGSRAIRPQNPNREPASSAASYEPPPQAEELTTFFTSSGNYEVAKGRLSDPKMQSDLANARVSITNRRNESFGADTNSAQVHLFDNGSAFVRKNK